MTWATMMPNVLRWNQAGHCTYRWNPCGEGVNAAQQNHEAICRNMDLYEYVFFCVFKLFVLNIYIYTSVSYSVVFTYLFVYLNA